MLLKHFLLYGEEGIADVTKSFSFQTRCITQLYEKVFIKNYRTTDIKQINFHCGEYPVIKISECVSGFCDVQVPYDINTFLSYPDYKKKIEALELLKHSLDFVTKEKGWDYKPFHDAYEKVKELNYTNEFIWGKPKMSPNKKYKAEAHCVHDLYDFSVKLIIRDMAGAIVAEKKVISTQPDELIYNRHLGELKWLGNNQVILFEKYSKGQVSISI